LNTDDARQASAADQIVTLATKDRLDLFHDPSLRSYASFTRNGSRETWPVRSHEFELHLRKLLYQHAKKSPAAAAVGDAIATLEATALFEGAEHEVHTRLGGSSRTIYIDLANEAWESVVVTPEGWFLAADSPVRFRRAQGMRPLPTPQRGGDLDELRQFINVRSDDEWKLLVGWLLSAARPARQPFPLLALYGEQGSAKSTTTELLRSLIDPNAAPLRAAPTNERDLVIAAEASWVLVLDNLSGIPGWLSDALCRLATGGGFATRELYSNDRQRIFDVRRPVILNGIEELGTRSDLLDRSVLVTLPGIPPSRRRSEDRADGGFREGPPPDLWGTPRRTRRCARPSA
jgi:hypothetical protein